jgi:putative transposase
VNGEWLSVTELSEALSVTRRAIQLSIKRGKYIKLRQVTGNGKGQGGKVWQISIEDPGIPSEIKDQYYKKHFEEQNDNPTVDGDKALTKTEPSLALSLPQTRLLSGQKEQNRPPAPCGHSEQGQGYLFPVPDFFPEKAKRAALARVDLIKAWKEYRKGYKKITDADNEFIDIYSSNILYKNLHDILGNVSIKTLYRWNKELVGTMDWTRLIPGHFSFKQKRENLSTEEKKVFLSFLLNPSKFDIGSAIKHTKTSLIKKGIPSDKSDRTFRRFAERFKAKHFDQWILTKEGQKALRDKVAPYIWRDPSLLKVGDVLIADGHRLNFQTINPFTGKPCRAVLVAYLDWKSWDIAGYEIMTEENSQCILSALRNSIIRLGKIPKHTYQDNGKAFRSRFFTSTESFEEIGFYGLLGRLGIIPIFAKPYNARAKPIERWFKEFSNTFEKLVPSYTGNSIENKPPRMLRNEKFHKALHREYIPTIQESIQLIEQWLEWQRLQPCPHVEGMTIGQVFDEGKGPGININDLDELMMDIKITKIGRNGIRLCNQEYYDKALYGLRENVLVRYSIFDLSYLKVFNMSGEFLCVAKRVQAVHPLAIYSGNPKDVEEWKQQHSQQRKLENETIKDVRRLIKKGSMELGWEKLIDATPRTVGKLEKVSISPGSANKIQYSSPDEAMKDFAFYMDFYLPGIPLSALVEENIKLVEDYFEKQIESHELNKANVEKLVINLKKELAKRDLILPEPENPEDYSPVFLDAWQKYEFLKNKQLLSEEEMEWKRGYEEGNILPGSYETIYKNLRQQNNIDNTQTLDKREEAL